MQYTNFIYNLAIYSISYDGLEGKGFYLIKGWNLKQRLEVGILAFCEIASVWNFVFDVEPVGRWNHILELKCFAHSV